MGAIKLYRGVSIYQVDGSRNWYVRIWNREKQRYIVKATGQTSAAKAREVALSHALTLLKQQPVVDPEFTFRHFAIKCISKNRVLVGKGQRNSNYGRVITWVIQNEDWGLMRKFGPRDVRQIKTRDFQDYIEDLSRKRPDLTPSTKNTILAAFRSVLKIARDDGVIDRLPDTPRTKQKDNPRPFFRFYPLVSPEEDADLKLRQTAADMAEENVIVRGVPITDELHQLIYFVLGSFVRPTVTELFALRHSDITIAKKPTRLLITIRNGKTGYRVANTLIGTAVRYLKIKKLYPDAKPEDYVFLPQYKNRHTAAKIIQRQFREVLRRASIEVDPFTGRKHTLYSLRHTAICMRIIMSKGKVNIFNLAKNAGTSVDQIERFYARNLPLSPELARNLQSMGD
jgi:hypothetical protein